MENKEKTSILIKLKGRGPVGRKQQKKRNKEKSGYLKKGKKVKEI